jgi:DNA-binding SARP family transcriptional activator
MLRVRLLGEIAVEADGRELEAPASRPARELLAWLALHPGSHPRLDLAQRFWPDVLETSARASLRTALHELRRALGAAHLVADRERVGLSGEPWVDLLAVRRLAHERRAEEALALCRGDPLPGLDHDWAIAVRDEHRELLAELLAGLSDSAPDAEAALRWARELVRLDPLSEEGARRLIALLARAGDRASALSAYARLEERLRRELRVVPSRRTRELVAGIRADADDGEPAPAGTGAAAAAGATATTAATAADAPTAATIADAARPTPRGPFAGRRDELARVAAGLAPGRLVLVSGEPGIGKTRLLAEAAGDALYGRCYEDSLTPYQPFVEALGEVLPEADGEGGRWRLFEAIGARLEGAVLVLDDLHWADAGTLRLLVHLLRRPRPPALAGAYRDAEVSRALADTLADLRRDGRVERVALTGLTRPEVAELVGEPLAATLHAQTAGNPFFVEQLRRHLADGGDPAAVPAGVQEVIGRRVSRLDPDARRVLALAAVAGQRFDLSPLETVLEQLDVLAALEEAERAQMLREERPGRYAFAHALVRETLYGELSLTRRARMHRALADALPEDRLAERAHHALEAGDASLALPAAAAATRAFAYEDAAALCERALAVLDDASGDRGELLLALGEARLRAGDGAGARQAFAAAARAGDPELLARAAVGYSGLGVTIIAVDREAVALLESALAALPQPHPLRARLVARLAIETYYESAPERRKALGDEAVALARAEGGDVLLDALNARHAALWSAQYLEERQRTADEMVALAARLEDAERELQGRNWRVLDLFERGDLRAARAEIAAHEQLAARLRLPAYEWWGPLWRSSLALLEGRYEDARALIAELRRVEDANAALYAEIQDFGSRFGREAFEGLGTSSVEREAGRPAEYAYRSGWAWILAVQGDFEAAREHIAWVTDDDCARLRDDMNRLAAMAELTNALAVLGEPGPAALLLARLAPYASRNIVNARGAAGYGVAAHYVAVLAALLDRREEAEERFEQALRGNAALGARPWLARTQERYAAFLVAHGDAARGRALAAEAAASARALGLARVAEQAAATLAQPTRTLRSAGRTFSP